MKCSFCGCSVSSGDCDCCHECPLVECVDSEGRKFLVPASTKRCPHADD